jgi:hypothetical protein
VFCPCIHVVAIASLEGMLMRKHGSLEAIAFWLSVWLRVALFRPSFTGE